MEKKNPYITTIGFDKMNPRHVQVAEFLNSLKRKKADYIVKRTKIEDPQAEIQRVKLSLIHI